MNELVELLDELQKKAKADSILREKLLQTRENPNPAKSAMPMAFPSMKWILPWQVKNFTQKSNAAPMAAEKIPRRLKGKMTSMSCFWQR